jgi:hypothetical protein
MEISHFHLFFWNHKTDLNQTWQKCSLDGHIQDLCFWCWSEIQHGCQGLLCVLIGRNFKNLSHVCFKLTYWFQRRRLLNIFSIGSYVKIKSSHGGHLEFPISKRFTSLVQDHPNFTFSSFFLKPQNRFEPNLAEMVIGWSYTRFLFVVLIGNPTWLPGPIMCKFP